MFDQSFYPCIRKVKPICKVVKIVKETERLSDEIETESHEKKVSLFNSKYCYSPKKGIRFSIWFRWKENIGSKGCRRTTKSQFLSR